LAATTGNSYPSKRSSYETVTSVFPQLCQQTFVFCRRGAQTPWIQNSPAQLIKPTFPIWVELGTDPSSECFLFPTICAPCAQRVGVFLHFLVCGPDFGVLTPGTYPCKPFRRHERHLANCGGCDTPRGATLSTNLHQT